MGGTLVASAGRWTGTAPIAFGYSWRRCTATGGSCRDISGASAPRYVVAQADMGSTVRVRVTARNAAGTSTAQSDATGVVAAGGLVGAPPTPPPSTSTPPQGPTPPPPPITPPGAPIVPGTTVTRLRARLDVNVVRLSWQAPTGLAVVVVRRIGARPRRPADGTIVYRGRARIALDRTRSARRVWYAAFPTTPTAASGGPAFASLARVLPRLTTPLEGSVSGGRVRFSWQPVRRARYYNVQVWNRGVTRRILTRWPERRQLTLRLPPGRYRWYVYPGFGTRTPARYGALIGQGSFRVR